MNVFDMFPDFPTATGTIYRKKITNTDGVPTEETVTVLANAQCKKWVTQSVVTDTSDQFVNDERGVLVFNPGLFTPTIAMWIEINSEQYYFVGFDNVIGSNEILQVYYRKDRKMDAEPEGDPEE